MEHVLQVENLVKNYGDFRAVDGISFAVPRGKIIGFLGPNGAGKTTTIQMLLGITLPNGGAISYFGQNFLTHRLECLQRINSASAFNTLQGRITVRENLLVFSHLYSVANANAKIDELLKRFEMEELGDALYQNLSAGQKTRVNLMKSLLNDPEVLLMDEPTASLDPDIADKTLSLIDSLKRERGLSILYTSHNMAEVTKLCDEVIFIDRGKIVAQDTPENLIRKVSAATLDLSFMSERATLETYLQSRGAQFEFPEKNRVRVLSEENLIPELLFGIHNAGCVITNIEITRPTLEDVFLQIARP